jgi:hypothetical protein
MRRIVLLVWLLMVCWGAGLMASSLAQQAPTEPPKEAAVPVTTEPWNSPPPLRLTSALGEQLDYTVSWANYLVAARLLMEIKDRNTFFERDGIQLHVQAQTVGVVRSLFIPVDDQFVSYIDPDTLLPVRFEKHLREGKRQVDAVTVFDHKEKVARLADEKQMAIDPETRDLVALFYYVRTLDLSRGKEYRFPAIFDDELFTVIVSPEQRASIKTAAGTFDAIEIALRSEKVQERKKEISDANRVRVWLSNDEKRIPVLITARPAFGEIRVELIKSGQWSVVSEKQPSATPVHCPLITDH